MACNCKVNKQILDIHKKYGHKINVSWKERVFFKTKEMFKVLIVIIPLFILSPFVFILFLFLLFRGKKYINVNNLIRKLIGKQKK